MSKNDVYVYFVPKIDMSYQINNLDVFDRFICQYIWMYTVRFEIDHIARKYSWYDNQNTSSSVIESCWFFDLDILIKVRSILARWYSYDLIVCSV